MATDYINTNSCDGNAEVWRTAPGFPAYSVSSHGRVRRDWAARGAKVGRLLRTPPDANGYAVVNLSRGYGDQERVYVHRIVALAFLGEPTEERRQIAHWDGNPANAAASNLRWATQAENEADKTRHGRRRGSGAHARKLSPEDVKEIRAMLSLGMTLRKVSSAFGVAHSAVGDIKYGKTYTNVY